MKLNRNGGFCLVGISALLVIGVKVRADVKVNPYEPIVERNAFGLKPPPPPPDNTPPPPPAAPPATVKLTGITSIGSKKKVLFEITPGPGKQPIKPIMEEGDRVESIEVVAIDVENNKVTIKNNGTVTNVTFEVAKSTPAPAGPVPGALNPAFPLPVNTSFAPPTPTAFTPNSVGGGSSGGRGGGVVVMGGNNNAGAAPGFGGGATSFGGPAAGTSFGGGSFGGGGAGGFSGNTPTVTGATDYRAIPRQIRTTPDPAANQPPVDPAQQYINMRASEIRARQQGLQFPPTPPIPGLE